MKKIIIALLAILPSVAFAQNNFFDKFEGKEGIEGVEITDNMLEVFGYFKVTGAGDEDSLPAKVKEFENVKAFITKDKKRMKEMRNGVADYLKKFPMEASVKLNNESGKINIYVRKAGNTSIIKEVLVFIEDLEKQEAVLLSFMGNIDLGENKTALNN
ncbi:hypothetical protein HYN59_09755 [Flavobacterium album]|uniref:DUF4252 domain-containing protein n=1 Tax=Flavobacterium album TaxID=2175091 RepID=A0A2S1QYG8_9FLAO|nr:DUF4252 domain-containing protein [Flavobacterium album]AWH85379.1 hypothetical protein HYN59_09755 [Flavobacterium album]